MAYWLSEPIETLIEQQVIRRSGDCKDPALAPQKGSTPAKPEIPECDVLVVGSGYGGAVAAMRLADPCRTVVVFERGKEYALGDFPENLGEAPGHIRLQRPDTEKPLGNSDALFDFRVGQHIAALVANGLGGGSLINANVAIAPDDSVFQRPEWPSRWRDDPKALKESMSSISELLGVTVDPETPGKVKALKKLATSLKASCDPAPIAVTFVGKPNAVGIHQEPCVRCGNCVTGCNVGAKNTLAMNILPLAKARGARLYTGATVLSVKPDGRSGWLVRYRRTATVKGPLHHEVHKIRAGTVILAAGTFGSTEILLRSQALGDLDCSRRLGEGFSGNGDALIFGYGQREAVGSIALGGSLAGPGDVGPTISGVARVSLTETGRNAARRRDKRVPGPWPRQVTLQDGAVPIILKRVFAEIVTAGSLIKRHTKNAIPAWCDDHKDSDPLGIHEDALRHSQLLLGMGDDGAPGKLVLVPAAEGGWDDARVAVQWRTDGADLARAFQRSLDAAFLDSEDGGFDGGDYIANPLALPLPEDFEGALSGGAPPGMQVTVHPLGGCPMGKDSNSGVVNEYGKVWRRRSTSSNKGVYEDLYVLDGAIIPVALGVNPFLTIAALADLSARHILETKKWRESEQSRAPLEIPLPRTRTHVPALRDPVRGKFKERLTGRLEGLPDKWLNLQPSEHPSSRLLVADIEIKLDSIDQLLAEPGREWSAKCKLSERPVQGNLKPLIDGDGTVSFFVRKRPGHNAAIGRAWLAINAFLLRRGLDVENDSDLSLIEQAKGFFRVAKNHGEWRSMVYRFTFGKGDAKWVLKGTKELAYEMDRSNVWTALTQLPVTAVLLQNERNATREQEYGGLLEVDLEELTKNAPLQVTESPNLPETLMGMVGTGMLFLRTLFQTHFWSFPAPDYVVRAPDVQRDPGPISVLGRQLAVAKTPDLHPDPGALKVAGEQRIAPEAVALAVSNAKDSVQIRLIRYANPEASRKQKVLLIHGLAHGACVFTTDTVTTSLAAYLYDRGLEPWLLEHRLSHALPGTAARPSNMDDIASGDIATAVDYLYRLDNEPISVFAHCIGAGAFSMAVLGGHCDDPNPANPRSKIKAAAIHAVPPWIVPSRANKMRANLAAFIKDVIGVGVLDPIPSPKDKVRWDETIIDRIARSLPWPGKSDSKHHLVDNDPSGISQDICNRMTLFYGVEWVHENLDPGTHRALAGIFGPGNLDVFRHVFFLAQRKHITDHEGRNVYLKEENVRLYWSFPTLFAHGTENKVFDKLSSRRSAARLDNLQQHLFKDRDRKTFRQVFLHEVPNYGHMDFIFGREAHIAVYPKLGDFLCEKYPTDPLPAGLDAIEKIIPPLCGPLIGDAHWVDSVTVGSATLPAGVHLRVWLESDENEAWPVGNATFALCPVDTCTSDTQQSSTVSCASQEVARVRGDYGLYLVYDVVVPDTENWTTKLKMEVRLRYESSDVEQRASINLALPWFKRLQESKDSKENSPRGCSFLIGSCRHPGSPFERDLCDKIMDGMLAQVRHGVEKEVDRKSEGVDHVLLVGDQIYADATADAFDTNEPGERFSARYRELFQSEGFKALACSVPIRMAIDDHEISNNWPGRNRPNAPARQNQTQKCIDQSSSAGNERDDQRLLEELETARDAANCYEVLAAPGRRAPEELWYQFDSGRLPFFVLDCRTQRVQRRGNVTPDCASMFAGQIGDAQCKAFEKWLVACANPTDERPKFIVSSIPLAPVLTDHIRNASLWRNADNWFGYPASLEWLANLFTKHKPKNVVFLSGDYHFSATAQLTFFDAACNEASAFQVVSSGLYAPMPFANERFEDYTWDRWEATQVECKKDLRKETKLAFKARRLSNSQSHFVRVDAKIGADNKWHVDVRAIQADSMETESQRLF